MMVAQPKLMRKLCISMICCLLIYAFCCSVLVSVCRISQLDGGFLVDCQDIETANKNLITSQRKNITFRVMDNLKMDTPDNYFDLVTARHTITDPNPKIKVLLITLKLLLFERYSLKTSKEYFPSASYLVT